VSRFLTTHQHN